MHSACTRRAEIGVYQWFSVTSLSALCLRPELLNKHPLVFDCTLHKSLDTHPLRVSTLLIVCIGLSPWLVHVN